MYLLDSVTPSKRRGHARRMLRACGASVFLFAVMYSFASATLVAMDKQEAIDREHILARCAAYPVTCGKGPHRD